MIMTKEDAKRMAAGDLGFDGWHYGSGEMLTTACQQVTSFDYAEVGRNGGWLTAEEVKKFEDVKEEWRRRHELVFGVFCCIA